MTKMRSTRTARWGIEATIALICMGPGVAAPMSAAAQEGAGGRVAPVERVTLVEALAAFADNSLALQIARAESREVAGAARQFRTYSNPAFTLAREDLGHSGAGYWEMTMGIVQRVEWPGRTAARRRVADHTFEGALARFRADSIRLAFEVRETYVRAWLAEAVERTVGRAAEVIRELAEAAERRLEDGDISAYEARRLRLERVRAEQSLANAALRVHDARRMLALLIAPESGTEQVGPSEGISGLPPVVNREEALAALSGRADLQAAARELEAARAESAAARLKQVPDPVLSLAYKDRADRFSGVAIGIDLALPLFDRGAGAREKATARESAALSQLGLRQREAALDLRAASDRYASTRDQLQATEGIVLEDAEALLGSARAAYAEGEMTLLELLDAADAYRDARVSALSLRSATWIAYYDLLRAMGGAPEVEDDR